jgi:hypothetical protein
MKMRFCVLMMAGFALTTGSAICQSATTTEIAAVQTTATPDEIPNEPPMGTPPTPTMSSSSDASAFASAPMMMATQSTQPSPTKKNRWMTAFNASVAALAAGDVIDSFGTRQNTRHHRFVCGHNPSIGAAISTGDSQDYNINNLQAICGSSNGINPNYAYDLTQLGMFIEGSGVTRLGWVGNRNYPRIQTAMIVGDVLNVLAVKYLSKKGGRLRKIGNLTLLLHAEEHARLGIDNLRAVGAESNPNTVFNLRPGSTPDWATGERWWGNK